LDLARFGRRDFAFHGSCGDGHAAAFLRISKLERPPGKNSVTAMNSTPSTYSQASGRATVNQLLAPLTTNAPSTPPSRLPRPPTATQIAISIELLGWNSLGLMMPTWGT